MAMSNAERLVELTELVKTNIGGSLVAAAVFSGIANLLMLVPAFYMLNVYDKAVGSNSLPTLLMLSIVTAIMFLGLGAMEATRSRVLVAIGVKLDREVGARVYDATFRQALKRGDYQTSAQSLVDFNALRQFVSGAGALTVLDAPWMPIYIVVLFMFHPLLGWMGVVSVLVMLAVAVANQRATKVALERANSLAQENISETTQRLRNAEVASAMGMFAPMREQWQSRQKAAIAAQTKASHTAGSFQAVIKTLRLAIQSVAIGLGAFLVLQQEISPGMLIAGSILVGRALQPIEMAVGSWKGFADAKGQYQRIRLLLEHADWQQDKMPLPQLVGTVVGTQASITPPGSETPTVQDSSFEIPAGTVCMIIGPSGAGKSSLIRGILGLWATSEGEIRIDGAEASHYDRLELGPQIGYLPQGIELFAGTVSANIARLGDVDADDVITAASDAGIHEFILSLPEGYDTELGSGSGVILSPGQRQRIALARALYRRPKLVVLDEPNSNLDQAGELALNRAIEKLKELNSTVIIVSHRQGAMNLADQLMVVSSGRILECGAPADVLARLSQHGGQSSAEHSASKVSKSQRKLPVVTVPV